MADNRKPPGRGSTRSGRRARSNMVPEQHTQKEPGTVNDTDYAEPGYDPEYSELDRTEQHVQPEPVNPAHFADEYQLQVVYDRQQRVFMASCTEFPELVAHAESKTAAVQELERRLDQYLLELERRGSIAPTPLIVRHQAESLFLKLSQGLLHRLGQAAKQEGVSSEQLATEFIAAGVEHRNEPARGNEKRPIQQHSSGRSGSKRGRSNRQSRRGYQSTMDNRENFMEYVRNLEKGGGYPKKR